MRAELKLQNLDINDIGNFRFIGAADNQRKRAERPAAYFSRLKTAGVDIEKHLLLSDFAADPTKLIFDVPTYINFRDQRRNEIWKIASKVVNPSV